MRDNIEEPSQRAEQTAQAIRVCWGMEVFGVEGVSCFPVPHESSTNFEYLKPEMGESMQAASIATSQNVRVREIEPNVARAVRAERTRQQTVGLKVGELVTGNCGELCRIQNESENVKREVMAAVAEL